MQTKKHYDQHLSGFYSSMFGDYDAYVDVQLQFLTRLNLNQPQSNSAALDLGCGSGFQSIALEKLGYHVYAVDFSAPLIDELKRKSQTVVTHVGDLTDLSFCGSVEPELIVCMGDTLTHLSSKEDVTALLLNVFRKLTQHGTVVLTYRDLSKARSPEDRFIPVKSDESRILTCFLEDISEEKVRVFDLLYERMSKPRSGN
jgi:SAM-dependent methyltransferase